MFVIYWFVIVLKVYDSVSYFYLLDTRSKLLHYCMCKLKPVYTEMCSLLEVSV